MNASVSSTGLAVVEMADAASKGQLTWLDLDGRVIGKVGAPGLIQAVAVSPDGKRALTVQPDDKGVNAVWMVDLDRGVTSRFSSGTGGFDPCWSPDGRQVAYADENGNLYVKATDGLSPARLVLKYDTSNQRPTSFTADGGTLLLAKQSAAGWDIFEVSLAGKATLKPLIATPANELNGRLSPDGRWLSWISEETGRGEAYVMPYPGGEKRQVSSEGADDAIWLGRDGDLAWVRDGSLFAARIGADGPGAPRTLLGGPVLANAQAVAAAPDGKRLLVALPADGGSAGSLTLIANWPTELSGK
jgi:Tol biopolymer transport system component